METIESKTSNSNQTDKKETFTGPPFPMGSRTPLIIQGSGNEITIIERQYNDQSASETVKSMLAADERADKMQEKMFTTIMGVIENAANFAQQAFAKRTETKSPEPTPEATKSAPRRKPAPKAPVKKAVVKKSAPKKVTKKK